MSSGAGRLRPRDARVIAIGAPAAAALTLSLLVLSSQRELDAELQLEADEHATAGVPLPVRARLYAGLSRIEGPSLQAAPCRVELLAEDRSVLATSWLRPGLGPSLEGAIAIPASLRGRARLRASAALGEQRVSAELELRVGGDRAAPIMPLPRRLPALQRLALGPLRAAGAAAPRALRPRIRGGACVPEQPCELLVHVGEPAAALQLRATPSATPDAASLQPSRLTSGVVALQVVVHGPEAVTELVATRQGAEVASRSLRLAVVLGSARALASSSLWRAGERARVALAGAGSSSCIVDAYGSDGRLQHSATLRDCAQPSELPFALGPGVSRLQLRSDPFGSDSAAVVTLYARPEGQSPADELATLAVSSLAIDGGDELARVLRADPSAASLEHAPPSALTASYLLAIHDEGLYATPSAVSSLPLAELELASRREGHRKLGLLVLALCALALAALVAERGLRSSAEARAVLAAAGSDAAAQRRQRARSVLELVSTVASLLLLFALVAVYVIVRAKGALPP